MRQLRIGIRLESLGLPFRLSLQEAGKLGAAGIQVDAAGELSPRRLSHTGRRELRQLLRSHNLELTALGCPLRRGLDLADDLEARIEYVKQVLAMSFDLGPRLVIVQPGNHRPARRQGGCDNGTRRTRVRRSHGPIPGSL